MNIKKFLIIINVFIFVFLCFQVRAYSTECAMVVYYSKGTTSTTGSYFTGPFTSLYSSAFSAVDLGSAYNTYNKNDYCFVVSENGTSWTYKTHYELRSIEPFIDGLVTPNYTMKTGHVASATGAITTCLSAAAWATTNYPQYCESLPQPCDDTEAVASCGSSEFVEWDNLDTCEWHCSQCDDVETQLQSECLSGYTIDKSNSTCPGECKMCLDFGQEANAYCLDQGGLQSFTCIDYEDVQAGTKEAKSLSYKCLDDVSPTEGPAPTPDPVTPPDPTPDPDLDPANTPDQDNTQLLNALKSNSDKQINQGNIANSLLSNIAENQKIAVNNQGVINNNLNNILRSQATIGNNLSNLFGQLIDTTNSQMSALRQAVADSGASGADIAAAVEQAIEGTATNDPMPDTPEYDSTLTQASTGYEFSENEDSSLAAGEKSAAGVSRVNDMLSSVSSPVSGVVTADNNACITGAISLRGQSHPISICFDKSWMMTGYAIMKVIFIAMGYLQTAILLNRVLIVI